VQKSVELRNLISLFSKEAVDDLLSRGELVESEKKIIVNPFN